MYYNAFGQRIKSKLGTDNQIFNESYLGLLTRIRRNKNQSFQSVKSIIGNAFKGGKNDYYGGKASKF